MCGDRNWKNFARLANVLGDYDPKRTMFIEGGAAGADTMAGDVAKVRGAALAVVDANWNYYHRAAGPVRNRWMLDMEPDEVLAFHNYLENSKGTKDMATVAKKSGVPVTVFTERDHYRL